MKLMRHERAALTFLLRHLLLGAIGALLFGGLVLYFDIGHLRTLAAASADGKLTIGLFFFGLVVTFGSIAMGIGVMSLGHDEN
jgi:hypothetical protein